MVTIKGGDKLKAVLAEISAQLDRGAGLRVGILSGATYPAGPAHETRATYGKRKAEGKDGAIAGAQGGVSVALVAATLEYGSPSAGIPPRPAIREMIEAKSPAWPAALGTILKANSYNAEKSLAMFGEGVRGQWQQAILNFSGEPLKTATIRRKGFDKQLVDTSHYVNSVDYEVEK
jgi:hypothetical protein